MVKRGKPFFLSYIKIYKMQETVLISLPLAQLQTLIVDAVNACLDVRHTNTPPQPESYITRQEAADTLHITLPTLLAWTLDGKVKGYRIGRRILYKKNEINEAVTSISLKKKGGNRK